MKKKLSAFVAIILFSGGILLSSCGNSTTVSESTVINGETKDEIKQVVESSEIEETILEEAVGSEDETQIQSSEKMIIETEKTNENANVPVITLNREIIIVGKSTFNKLLDSDYRISHEYWFDDEEKYKADLNPGDYESYYVSDPNFNFNYLLISIVNTTNKVIAYNDATITGLEYDTFSNTQSRLLVNDFYVHENAVFEDFNKMVCENDNNVDESYVVITDDDNDKECVWKTHSNDGYIYIVVNFKSDDKLEKCSISYSEKGNSYYDNKLKSTTENLETAAIEASETDETNSDEIVDNEEQWDAWVSSNTVKLGPFMNASEQVGFSWSWPSGQTGDEKECDFYLKYEDGSIETIPNMVFYYYVVNQTIKYIGLYTEDKDFFESEEFRRYCRMITQAYNCHFEEEETILNLTEEQVEKIVDYAFDEKAHCLANGMRIRVVRNEEKPYYSYHLEY